ncbi:MAG: hypothetical protein IH987_13625, partial [Planctomycetes bacterium]|nr:hypothetical protein [Planctomycetota bacterium]
MSEDTARLEQVLRNISDCIKRVMDAVAEARGSARGRSADPDVLPLLKMAIEGIRKMQKDGCPQAKTPNDVAAFEVVALFARASLFGDLTYNVMEVRKRHPSTPELSPQTAKKHADEAIACCREARELLSGPDLKWIIQRVFQMDIDNAQAHFLSEAALNALFVSGPEAAANYLRESVRLQPNNARFLANLAANLLKAEQSAQSRNRTRCEEILDRIEAVQQSGVHESLPPMLAEYLHLPGLPDNLRNRAVRLAGHQKDLGGTYDEEMALYRKALLRLPGPTIEFRLVDAQIRPSSSLQTMGPGVTGAGSLLAIAARYRSSTPIAPNHEAVQRLIELTALALACSLGKLAERVQMRLQSHRPLPDLERVRHGPEWKLNQIHHNITVSYCHVPDREHAPLLDLEVWFAQTEVARNAITDSTWKESYFNLLSRLTEGLFGYGHILRIGDEVPLGVTTRPESRNYRRIRVPGTQLTFCVP